MKAVRLLILMGTVTLLSACGGKKGSKPNMIKPQNKAHVEQTDEGFRMLTDGACQAKADLMTKKEICEIMRDKIAADDVCMPQYMIQFKNIRCEAEVDTTSIESKLAQVEVSEDGQEAIVEAPEADREFDFTVDMSEARIVMDDTGAEFTTETGEVSPSAEKITSYDQTPLNPTDSDVIAFESSESAKIVNEPITEEDYKTPAEVNVDVAVAEANEEEVNKIIEAKKTAEVTVKPEVAASEELVTPSVEVPGQEPNIRFFPDLKEAVIVNDIAPQAYSLETEISEKGTITRTEVKESIRGDKITAEVGVAVDSRLSMDKKLEIACQIIEEKLCEASYEKSTFKKNRCVRRIKKSTIAKCIRENKKKNQAN